MRKAVVLGLVVFLLLVSLTLACAGKPAVYDIPKLDTITIDGDGADWGEQGFQVGIMVIVEGALRPANEFDSGFRLGWNNQGLLALVNINTNSVHESPDPGNLWQGDSVELYLSPKLNSPESLQIIVAPGVDPKYPKPRHFFWGNPSNKERLAGMKVEVASKKTAAGYQVEALVPWSNVGIVPQPGLEFPFQTYANDLAGPGEWVQMRWHPAEVNAADLSNSAYLLRLARTASPAIIARTHGAYQQARSAHVYVTGAPELIGTAFSLKSGKKTLADGVFANQEGRATADISLPMLPRGQEYGELRLVAQRGTLATVTLPSAAAARIWQLKDEPVSFKPYCFSEASLPSGDFEHPLMVESLIGPYQTKTAYYGADFAPITSAEKIGRYGAVLEVQLAAGRTIKRFQTVCRTDMKAPPRSLPLNINPEIFAQVGVKPAVAKAEAAAINDFYRERILDVNQRDPGGAALLAGLYESGGGKRDFSNNIWAADRQWWVDFKRKYYGTDKVYPQPFVSPRKVTGAPAPTVHEGTLAQAGFTAAGVKQIDALCQEWAANSDEAFGVCIVRHGVIVLHKAYGTRDGKPMTLKTPSWLASITKLMAGSLIMQLVDQGLVDLDEPVDKYLPALRDIKVETPLTVRHLYTHTNGLSGHWGDEMNDLEEVIADLYPHLQVGKYHEYNGVGYALGSKIVETVSGEALPQFYKHHLLDPLGMTNTTVTTSSWDAQSTPLDMAKLGQMLLNGGAYGDLRFFSKETFGQMLPVKLTKLLGPETSLEWGIGMIRLGDMVDEAFSPQTFGHGAASNTTLAIDPVNDIVIVMTRNNAGENFFTYSQRFSHAIAEVMVDPKK